MSTSLVYLLASAALFGIGLYGLLTAAHVLRKLLALNVMGGAVFLLLVTRESDSKLVTLAARDGAAPDPVAQALVLTGIVVAVATTAFALALMVRLHAVSGSTELDDD
ncbi:MAG TPA: cation:proton antiporter subunit C [Xanthomonadaceae bacterium]|nr:cation:proton antiporter subunit C [Xanthomonadaceae bacterium]